MAKFKTWEDVRDAYSADFGSQRTDEHTVVFSDIEKFQPVVERLLETDYHQINGFSLDEMLSALDSTKFYTETNFAELADSKGVHLNTAGITESAEYQSMVNEAFGETTAAQAPFPIPSLAFTQYIYEKSVAPYFAHIFDLGGNRGFVYYQKVVSNSAEGNVSVNDLLGSPRQLSKQALGFVDGRVIAEQLAVTVLDQKAYTKTLANAVMPGSLVIRVEGTDGYFIDSLSSAKVLTGPVALYSVDGKIGECTVDYSTLEVNITLDAAPTTAGLKITADYNREEQTTGTTDIPEVSMTVESEKLIAEDFNVKIKTGVQQEYLSRLVFGKEWNTMADEAMGALYNKEVANKIMSEIKAGIPPTSTTTHDISSAITTGGNNALFNTLFMNVVFNKLKVIIAEASGNMLNTVSAYGIATNLIPIFEYMNDFKPANIDTESTQGGATLIGTYKGVPVVAFYKSILAEGEVVAIYKSKKQRFLTPYCFGEFIKPMIRTIFDQNNLGITRRQLIGSAAGKLVAPLLASKLTVTGVDTVVAS